MRGVEKKEQKERTKVEDHKMVGVIGKALILTLVRFTFVVSHLLMKVCFLSCPHFFFNRMLLCNFDLF